MLLVTPVLIAEWRGLESYEGGPSKLALPLNLKNQLEFLLYQKFADICLQDWQAICMEIDYIPS